MGKGGSGTQYVESTTQTSNLPEYARPYYEGLLNQAEGILQGGTYTPYQGQRIADFTPSQLQTQQATMGLQTPGQYGTGTALSTMAGLGALNAGNYNPYSFNAQQIGQPNLNNYQMSSPGNVSGSYNYAPSYTASQTGYNPNIYTPAMQAAGNIDTSKFNVNASGLPQVSPYMISGAQTGYNPTINDYTTSIPGEFGQAEADKYMSPYMQSVIDVAKRKAYEDAQQVQLANNLGAARQGTYGGARQLLAATERERALKQQLGDLQVGGLQSAFENAQQQFERDRQANQGAQQFNVNSLLNSQALRTNTGLQVALANLDANQQALVANQAAAMQAQGLNADQALRAALANQQTGLQGALANQQNQYQTGLANLEANLRTQGLSVDTGLRTALANLDAQSQANVQNLAAKLQTQGLNSDQALRAALANQQTGLSVGQSNLQSLLNTQQLGANTGLAALQSNQQYGLEAQRLNELSRQFGANLGLQGLTQANQSAQTLGNLGQLQQNSDLSILNAQNQIGNQQQQLNQQYLDQAYADFLRQRDYPIEMLQYYNAILRGLPITPNSVTTSYAPPPSMASQVLGTGLGALGLANSLGG